MLGFAFWQFGWEVGAIAIVIFFVTSVVAGVLLPAAGAPYFIRRIYASMVRRYANFTRDRDVLRAEAIQMLMRLVEGTYGSELKAVQSK